MGPVFTADLRSHTRKARVVWLRLAFLLVLFLLFLLVYSSLPGNVKSQQSTILADYASRFVTLFMLGQFLFLLIVGPTYVANAIAEERQRGTLDYLFASALSNREIITGKYFSRLLLLLQYVLIGFPVLAMVHLIGGVSMELMLGLLLGTIGCTASLTALTLLLSVVSKQSKDALIRTFLLAIALLVLWFLLLELLHTGWIQQMFSWPVADQILYGIQLVLHMNPVYTVIVLRNEQGAGGNIEELALRWFGTGFCMHVLLAAGLVLLAVYVVRRWFLKQSERAVRAGKMVTARINPQVWEHFPLLWKERYLQRHGWIGHWLKRRLSGTCSTHLGWAVVITILAVFTVFGLAIYPVVSSLSSSIARFLLGLVFLVSVAALILAHFLALIRVASSIAQEKVRDTWDTLLASPVSLREILLARLYGGYLAARWCLLFALVLGCYLLIYFSLEGEYLRNYNYYGYPTRSISSSKSDYSSLLANFIICLGFVLSNAAYLYFTCTLALYFSLFSNSIIRNVMSALTMVLVLNLMPLLLEWLLGGSDGSSGMVELLYAVTSPGFVVFLSAMAGLIVLALVCYYHLPKLRWIYSLVKWLGNIMLMYIGILTIITCVFFAFGGLIDFLRLLLMTAPISMVIHYLLHQFLEVRYYGYNASLTSTLFMCSSAFLLAIVAYVLYRLALQRLQVQSGRIEHSRLAKKHLRSTA